MTSLYIHYAKNAANQLIIACYHEKVQSLTNAVVLARKVGIPYAALEKLEISIPEPYSDDEVKTRFLKLLQIIKTNSSLINQVYFTGDLNLCCYHKNDLALFLFDNTIHDFFKDSEYVHLTLESMNHDYVSNAIAEADSRKCTDLIIKTKSCVKENPLCKSYPSSAEESKPSFFKNAENEGSGSSYQVDSCCFLG